MHCSLNGAPHPWRQALPKIGLVLFLLGISLFLTSGIGLAATGSGSIAGTISYIGGVPGEHPILVCAFSGASDPDCKHANADGTYEIPLLPDGDFTVRALVNVYSDSYDDWSGAVEGWYDPDGDGQLDEVSVSGGAVTGVDIYVGGPWIPLSGPAMPGGQVVALTVDALAPQVVYAAVRAPDSVGNGVVYRSADSGATWAVVDAQPASLLDLYASGGKVCQSAYGDVGQVLICSVDSGGTWAELPTIDPGHAVSIFDVAISSEVSSTMLVAGIVVSVTEGGEEVDPTAVVYGTTDGGASWERLFTRPSPDRQFVVFDVCQDPSDPDHYFFAGNEQDADPTVTLAVIHEVANGDWAGATRVYTSTSYYAILSVVVDPEHPEVVLAGTFDWMGVTDYAVLRSGNGGDTWGVVTQEAGGTVLIPSGNHAYAITPGGTFYASTDGGATWSDGVFAGNHCNGFAAGDDLFAGGCNDGVLRSTDGGATWAPSSSGISSLVSPSRLAIDPADGAHMFAAANCAGGWRSDDGGATWKMDLGGCIGTYAFDPRRAGVVYRGDYSTLHGALERSADGGASWEVVYTATLDFGPESRSEAIVFAIAPAPSRPATVYAAGADNREQEGRHATIVRSTGNGVAGTWTEVFSMTHDAGDSWVNALAVHPYDARVVYAGGARNCDYQGCQGFVQRTTDGGATWSTVFTDTQEIKTIAIDAADPGTLYAGSASYRIFRSADDGESWTAVRLPPWEDGDVSGDQVVADPRAGGRVYLGGWATVRESLDGGDSWLDQQSVFEPAPQQNPVSLMVVDHGNRQTLYFGAEGLWSFTRLAPPGVYRNAIPSVIRPSP